jgi:biopolymer transport protein ExbD
MAMSVGSSESAEPEVMVEMNTTPLIDVMLVLLIMLIITIPIQTNSVKMDLPAGNPPPPPVPPPVVELDIDFDGTITWNGTTIGSESDLVQHLDAAAAANPQPEIHVHPNKLVTYKYVIHVMADAQRLGVNTIGIVGNEQFING